MQPNPLLAQYIEPNPHKPGLAEARLRDYGISVWALIGHLHTVKGDVMQVAADYDIPLAAVEAALAYYEQHKSLIDARLESNNANQESLSLTL